MTESVRQRGRRFVPAVIIVAAVGAVVVLALARDSSSYTVEARFLNAGQLVRGNPVQTGGVPIGSVEKIKLGADGQAVVVLSIDEAHSPLRHGTRATIRQFSQSGIANRYVDLAIPPGDSAAVPDGGELGVDATTTAVDLDQLLNTLDPATRRALQRVFAGQARQFRGRGREARQGLLYLNPALATTSRLFRELNRDTPALERFLSESSKLVGTLASRRAHLGALVGELKTTTGAIASEKEALGAAIERLPPFMRRANTTFVSLRGALDHVDPLVDAARPAARRLGPFLTEARALAADAAPTFTDLRRAIASRGEANDLIELFEAVPPLAEMTLASKDRSAAPGGRQVRVGVTRGTFPEAADAFAAATPEVAFIRPYTSDFLGWFDDFSTTGAGYDAVGATSRGHITFVESMGGTSSGHFRRCPGGAEIPALDGSNILSQEEQDALHCTDADRAARR